MYFCKMIKKNLIVLLLLVVLVSCNRTYERAMKSNDPELILNAANQMYEDGKWAYSIDLYQKVSSSFAGTDKAEDIAYNSAMANFNDKNYPLAARQFKNYYISYRSSKRSEEALFMSAFSYYKGSPDYNLDQKNTHSALRELQGFIDVFPGSSRVKDVNAYMKELQHKLEKKNFAIAKSYYKTLKFKSAEVAFANFLDDFPDSSYREEAYIYLLRAQSQLAIKSVYSKKELRLTEATTRHRLFKKYYPESEYTKEADQLMEQLNEEKILFEQEKKKVEEFNQRLKESNQKLKESNQK